MHASLFSGGRKTIAQNLRLIVGNGGRKHVEPWFRNHNWATTESEWQLDISDPCAWLRVFGKTTSVLDALVAEHVMEHMTPMAVLSTAATAYYALQPGGNFRIAVPDGHYPNASNELGGYGTSFAPHRVSWTHLTLPDVFRRVGFHVEVREWCDTDGAWHATAC